MHIENIPSREEFYYSKIISSTEFNQIMTDEHLYIADSDNYIIDLLKNISKLKEKPEIVELGCGPGRILQHICRALPEANISGLDIDADFLKHAKAITDFHKNIEIHRSDVEIYKHHCAVDVFISQGMHHHVAKGKKTIAYLKSIYSQLNSDGYYILSDEFLPNYDSVKNREIETVIWHSHIISHALSQGYNYLANEEAKTLLDDIYEGRQEPSIKNHAQIECVLKAVDEINNFATQGDTKEAAARAGVLLNNLESLHNLTQVGDDRIDLSRQDFKICKSEFIKEINEAGFIIESCKEFGNLDTFGGFIVWTLRKS